MTPERKAELRALLAAATPATHPGVLTGLPSADFKLMVQAVIALPELLDALDAAERRAKIAESEADLRAAQAAVATNIIADTREILGIAAGYVPDNVRDLVEALGDAEKCANVAREVLRVALECTPRDEQAWERAVRATYEALGGT